MTLEEFLNEVEPLRLRGVGQRLDIYNAPTKGQLIKEIIVRDIRPKEVFWALGKSTLEKTLKPLDTLTPEGVIQDVIEVLHAMSLPRRERVDKKNSLTNAFITFCPSCEKESPKSARVCIFCGNNFPTITCENCQVSNVPEAKFCMSCGQVR
mgnify:CR=1 FL=1